MKDNFNISYAFREDLMAAYRNIAPRCWSQQEAWRKTAESPAPRYYISGREAYEKMKRLVQGDFSVIKKMRRKKYEMYISLFNTLVEMSQRKIFIGKSLRFICDFVVTEPAPSFFVTPATVKFIFFQYRKYGKYFPSKHDQKRKAEHRNKTLADLH